MMNPLRFSAVLLAAGSLLAAGCSRREPAVAAAAAEPLAVRTALAERLAVTRWLEVPATVRPAERATLAAKVTGRVADLRVVLGDRVAAGDVLIRLDAPEILARVAQARAQVTETARTAVQEAALATQGVSTAEAARVARDRAEFAAAALREAEAMLEHTELRAPFDGVVTARHVRTGDLAAPGLPLLALESTLRLRAESHLPETASSALRPGDELTLLGDNGARLAGRIEEISPAADPATRTREVSLTLPPDAVRSGQYLRVRMPLRRDEAVFVPADAVQRFGQMERVYLIEDSRAVLRLVRTGGTDAGRTEILAGLNGGETVLLSPPAALREGAPVSVAP